MTYALRAASTDPAANPPRTTPLLKTSISLIRTRDDHVTFMSLYLQVRTWTVTS